MRLQSVVLPDKPQSADLYFRGETALSPGCSLSLDTFYNCFSYSKYLEYTTVENVTFSCDFIGTAYIELCVYDGCVKVICAGEFTGTASISTSLSGLPKTGFIFPRLTALTDCVFIKGGYYSDCEPRSVSCCIAICTYKREEFVKRNLSILRSFKFSCINRVFVIDNGNTLDCAMLSDDVITIVPNRNHGGSGGFTRGLIEALNGDWSHIIFMDDDVQFYPETLEQMTVFVSLLRDEHISDWFSAGMMPLDKPWLQYELGAFWDGSTAHINHSGLDMAQRDNILCNMDEPLINYGGWWTLCMPVTVTDNGLPYPFFIKFDDMEYGLRRKKAGIITMNGISVRHEAFDLKTSFVLDYYNLRNQLVVSSLYGQSTGSAVKLYLKYVFKQLVLYRYDNIPVIMRAVNDFIAGVDFFLNVDSEQLNSELISSVIQLTELCSVPQWSEELRCDNHVKNTRITPLMAVTAAGHLIPWFALKGQITAVPLSRAGACDFFRRRAVIQYQLGGDKGVYTNRNTAKFIKYCFVALRAALALAIRYKNVSQEYCRRRNELTSREFWEKDLGL